MANKQSFWSTFYGDQDGVTVLEFAVVAPVFLLLIMGTFDVAHTLYVQSVLQGAVNKAGRDSALETTNIDVVNGKVWDQVAPLLPPDTPQPTFTRTNFQTFTDASSGRSEPYNETNGVDGCQNGERYKDWNGNGQYDSDINPNSGQGGARDVVKYNVTIAYTGLFPVAGAFKSRTLSASTVLANQPFGDQKTPSYGNCN